MTSEKARDFFSAYYEGCLEPGLSVSFEQKLKADESLRHEYDAFARAMGDLDVLKFEDIAIPQDLHDRISARLDRHLFERKQRAKPAWAMWVRGVAFAGVAGVAIFGTMLALNGRDPRLQGAGTGLVPARDPIIYKAIGDGVTLRFSPTSVKTIVIMNEGREVSRSVVGDSTAPGLETVLSNPLPTASVFAVQVSGEQTTAYVALPGKSRLSVGKGEGTVVEVARAISDYFRVPVTLETRVPNERKRWAFGTPDAVGETSKALGSNYSVTLHNDGILEIEQQG